MVTPNFDSPQFHVMHNKSPMQLIVVAPQNSAVNWFSQYHLDANDLYGSLLQWRAFHDDHYIVVRLTSGGDAPYELLYTGKAVDAQFTTTRQLALPVPEALGYLDPLYTVVYVVSENPVDFLRRLTDEMNKSWPWTSGTPMTPVIATTTQYKGPTDA